MTNRIALLVLASTILLLGGLATPLPAHESRPAFVEIVERDDRRHDVLLKRPARGPAVLSLTPRLEPPCAEVGTRLGYTPEGATVERWTIDCGDGGLAGRALRIDGLETTMTDVLVRIAHLDGASEQALLRPGASTYRIEGAPDRLQIAAAYTRLGIAHILTGIDHLLFVLALLLLVRRVGPLIKTITAFTVAHSLTLGLATLGVVRVPGAPVEAAIALSIVYLAAEILYARRGAAGLTSRQPWLVAFLFGLLHGLGFAGALTEVGLPEHEIPLALLFFNVGVEIGQLLFVAACLGVLAACRRLAVRAGTWAELPPAYAIGSLAAFWFVERTVAILGVT